MPQHSRRILDDPDVSRYVDLFIYREQRGFLWELVEFCEPPVPAVSIKTVFRN